MAVDDPKTHRGQGYAGMTAGGMHEREYPHGIRLERKLAPDRRAFTFRSEKRRMRDAPAGPGALPGTEYHGFILAHQG